MISTNHIELAILAYVLFSFVRGIQKGLFGVLASILGVYGAAFIAWKMHPYFFHVFNPIIGLDTVLSKGIIIIFLWLFTYLLIGAFGRLLTYLLTLTGGGLFLRVTGGLFNGGKAIIISSVIVSFLVSVLPDQVEESHRVLILTRIGDSIIGTYESYSNDDGVQMIEPEVLLY